MTLLTITGTVAPVTGDYGIDNGNYFGGGSLAGMPFTVTWEGIDCDCHGSPGFSPVISASLTINLHTYVFEPDLTYGAYNDFYTGFQQIEVIPGNILLATNSTPGGRGVFYIQECCDGSLWTQAFLNVSTSVPIHVPAPIAGAGLLPLLLLSVLIWKFAS